jgi:prepilin-type N-terminal cleavage/methylation domain-containing protein
MSRESGFTLIELMIVVAILGILSSVAIPSFQSYQLRSRAAERTVLMKQIQSGVSDLWVRDGKFPHNAGLIQWIACPPNPAGPPSSMKRRFVNTLGDWATLSTTIEGHVYFSYDIVGLAIGGVRQHTIRAEGDLDDDDTNSELERDYVYLNEQPVAFTETPAGGKF